MGSPKDDLASPGPTPIPTPSPPRRSFGRSSSFSSSSHRASVPTPPPLCISRPLLLPRHWPHLASSSDDPSATNGPPSAARHSQLAFFDRECSRVEDHLYLGSDLVARDRDALRRHGITHVLSCVGGPEPFRPDLSYKTLWLSDTPSQDITSVLYDVFDFFEEVRCSSSTRVLVHCSRGVSRSAALVVAYLMWRHSLPFDAALRRVRSARPVTDPNLGFASQLLSFQNRILCSSTPATATATSSPPAPSCRLYRMAPHSPYDPLHLVPKPVDRRPSPADLDSRGAFVLHAPSAVYVWVGIACDQAMARSAAEAACQVVRYEKAAGSILAVHEGSETPDFWSSFGDCGARCPPGGGARMVESYDLDFEIFGRAMKGGVVPPFQPPSGVGSPTRLPAKESGWGRLRQNLLTGGMKELVTCCRLPQSEDRDMEPFGSPQSSAYRDLGTPSSSSDFSTLSPASSSSDWYNSSSPGSEYLYDGELLVPARSALQGEKGGHPDSVESRGEGDDVDEPETVKEWPFSPFRMSVDDECTTMEFEHPALNDADRVLSDEEHNPDVSAPLNEPALFRWPSIEQVDDLHPGVLDSESIFLLLAPEPMARKRDSRILYLWIGGKAQLADDKLARESEGNTHDKLQKIGREFLHKKNYSVDIPVQVIREDEEPQQFLDHLFSFHQTKEKGQS